MQTLNGLGYYLAKGNGEHTDKAIVLYVLARSILVLSPPCPSLCEAHSCPS